jgi:hypothetical protein
MCDCVETRKAREFNQALLDTFKNCYSRGLEPRWNPSTIRSGAISG